MSFARGVEVLVEAPARCVLDSDKQISLVEGKLVATVSAAGKGFTVRTASARFCKELWARLRVHRSVSVHRLFGLGVTRCAWT